MQDYLDKQEDFRLAADEKLLEEYDSFGQAADAEHQIDLIIGVKIHRDVYSRLGYAASPGAPEMLHACVIALLDMIWEMPIIRTVQLTPADIAERVSGDGADSEEAQRWSSMALAALYQAFTGVLAERKRKTQEKDN